MLPQLRRYTHDQRVQIAHQISDRVLDKYGNDVLAVYIYGSTSKNLDRPYSDLEMNVIVGDGVEIPMKSYLFNGLVVNIEYLQSSRLLNSAEQFTKDWHWEADSYRNRIVVYERDHWFDKLDRTIEKNERADPTEAIRKSFMMMTESMAVLKNDLLTKDKNGILMRARTLAEDAARIVLLLNRKYVITTSWFWKITFEAPKKPEDFKELVEKMSGFVPTTEKEIVVSSEKLYGEIYDLIASHISGIERNELWV
ncbi:hypothetical protein J2P12_00310 [Candidatus Bathyarchaeota archaeon]|nr:hypothetical protein [Candidatus Bathyarchaeota archaeon]